MLANLAPNKNKIIESQHQDTFIKVRNN